MNGSYKTIAVHVDDSPYLASRVKLAAKWATKFSSHLVGVAATGLPALFYVGGGPAKDERLIPAYRDYLQKSAGKALATFETIVNKEAVRSYEKYFADSEPGLALCMQARYSDLLVIGQEEPTKEWITPSTTFPDYIVLHTGNPVLIAPRADEFSMSAQQAMIAWDGSVEASHAIRAAIPVLLQARTVRIAIFNADGNPDRHGEEPGADLALFLARHDIKAEVLNETTAGDIGDAMLSLARDTSTDLLVMGAYGHTHLREMIVGGVTRTVLRDATIPLLVAH